MNIFSFLQEHGSPPSPTDEILYEYVAAELSKSVIKQGLWTKALSDAEWNEPKAKSLYVKMRIAQLRGDLFTDIAQHQAFLTDPTNEARALGLQEEDIEYLGKPIKADRYIEKYRISKDKLSKAIGNGKIRGVLSSNELWVQDKKIS